MPLLLSLSLNSAAAADNVFVFSFHFDENPKREFIALNFPWVEEIVDLYRRVRQSCVNGKAVRAATNTLAVCLNGCEMSVCARFTFA